MGSTKPQQAPGVTISSRKPFRVAPSRDGRRAASAWRFWKSGDEFYAAVRDIGHITKISFHGRGNWQVRIGPAINRLFTSRHISSEWTHAVSLQWVILPDSFEPISSGSEDVHLLDVPESHKLALDLLVSRTKLDCSLPPADNGGKFIWRERLRSGRSIALHSVTVPWTTAEVDSARRLRAESVVAVDGLPQPGEHYAEVTWFAARPTGNVVQIVPHGPDSVRLKDSEFNS